MIERIIDRITALSIRFKWVTIALTILIMAAGILAVVQLNQELLPQIEFPQSVVLGLNPGADTDLMLSEVTIPLEEAVSEIDGVVNIESTTTSGASVLIVRNEFGLDSDEIQEEIREAIASVDYPAGMETPELLSFSLTDLPIALLSVSSDNLSLAELRELVEVEIVPELEEIDGVAEVQVSGGQALPAEAIAAVDEPEGDVDAEVVVEPSPTATAEPSPTATAEPSPTATAEPSPTATQTTATLEDNDPVALPESWVQAAAAQGVTIETTADLTPELVAGVVSFAPELLEDLTPEMLLAMPVDVLAALPEEYLAGLDQETQAALAERVAQAEAAPGEQPDPVALPESWVQAAAAQGVTIETTADLTPELVAGVVSFAPELLEGLTPEMLLAMPVDVLAALPEEYLAGLDQETQAALAERVAEAEAAPGEQPDPVALPESWVQAAAAQGVAIETTADLTPELVAGVVSFAPELLEDLTPEMLLAMPVDVLAALPEEYLAGLDEETQAALAERVAATEESAEDAAAEGVPLPESWQEAAAAQGMELETTADLTPQIVGGIAGFAPELLGDLTPEMLLALEPDVFAALPPDYVAELDEEVQAQLLEQFGELPQAEAEETDPELLPQSWQMAGQAQDIELVRPEDVTPEIIQGIGEFAPQLLADLSPENLRRFSPDVLVWLPSDYVETLNADLRAELEELAEPAGGLSAAFEEAEATSAELAADAPALPPVWTTPPEDSAGPAPTFETAADLLNSGFAPSAAELLNLLVTSGQVPNAPELMGELTPEIILWLAENEEGFLENLNLAVLRLFSPEVINALPEAFLETLGPALREELEGIAAGTVSVFVPENTITRLNQRASLNLSILKTSDANTVAVSDAVFERLDELTEANGGLNVNVAFEQASFIEESVSGVAREGALGAVFAVIVILFFLSGRTRQGNFVWSWRSTLVTAVSIPLSVFMAFALLRWFGPALEPVLDPLAESTADIPIVGAIFLALTRLFPANATLNIMTLSGMTVAIGRVVDDSIVVLENIYRHIQRGEDQLQSVLVGTRDVAIAILASTITTVVVFLPIGLIGGIIGEFFLPFGVAVTYALVSSFLVAITVVPLLAFLFIRAEHLPPEGESTLQKRYTPVLRWALDHRLITLVIAAVLFAGSVWLLGERPQAFLPDLGEVQITTTVDLPDDFTIVETNQLVLAFEEAVEEIEGLGVIVTEVGTTGGLEQQFLGGGVVQSAASIQIGVEDPEQLDRLTAAVRAEAQDVFGEEDVVVSGGTLATSAFGSFALVLSGDGDLLREVNDEVLAVLEEVDGLANPASNLGEANTILRVDGEPAVRYTGELETQDTLGITQQAMEAVERVVPDEIVVSEGFETEQQTEGFAQAIEAIAISIVAVYIVMVIAFHSIVHPFTILFSLPLAIIGAAAALWLTDRVVGLSALVGIMMLVGIVVTNAIVLIDRVQANRKKRGMTVREALMEGGRTRLRPILMTAIAAMMALLPLAAGLSEGAIVAAELGTVVIGGLFSSTLLTLLVVPVMYSLLDRLTRNGRNEA